LGQADHDALGIVDLVDEPGEEFWRLVWPWAAAWSCRAVRAARNSMLVWK
jgi:hypothetical protein